MMTNPWLNNTLLRSSVELSAGAEEYPLGSLPGDLRSNRIEPQVEEYDPWHDILDLKRLRETLMSGITSAPFRNCQNYHTDQPEYISRCASAYILPPQVSENGTGYITAIDNPSKVLELPIDNPEDLTNINMTNLIAYSILFPIAAVGNLLVLVALFRSRHRKSRVNLMILHLSLADMIITFIFLPMEITWQVTIQWKFGNLGCKVYKFFSAFGFYMSSMVLVCISLDRYFAVLHPLKVNDAQRRGKIMIFFAWVISAFISLPQVCICIKY